MMRIAYAESQGDEKPVSQTAAAMAPYQRFAGGGGPENAGAEAIAG